MKKAHLLIIDPQNDFCEKSGALYVPGADSDMNRLADFIDKYQKQLTSITVTFDSHKSFHIANPIFWIDAQTGTHPEVFTTIRHQDVLNGRYFTSIASHQRIAEYYVGELEHNGRYELCIWPPHCLVGSQGANIYGPLFDAIERYNQVMYNTTEYVYKSSNSFSEQYSVLRADVGMNEKENVVASSRIAHVVASNDVIFVAGEALSHCVANSLLDIAKYVSKDLHKFILLSDATSSVRGADHLSDAFLYKAYDLGMRTMKTTEVGVLFDD